MEKRGKWVVMSLMVVLVLFLSNFCYAQTPIKWKGQSAYTLIPELGPFKYGGSGGSSMIFAKWLNKETKGQFKLDVAQPGSIVPVSQMFDAVSKGVLDFGGLYYGGFHIGKMPEADIEAGLIFAWEKTEEAWDAFYNRGLIDEFQKIYAEHNLYFIPHICGQHYGFGTTFPCPNLDAIKGKKIRATGIYGEFVKKLGGSPVVIASPEMYMALKLGTIDGAIFGFDNLELVKLKEVWTNYVFEPNLSTIVGSLIINLDSFKKLPEEIRWLIDNYAKHILLEQTMNTYAWEFYLENLARKTHPSFKLVSWSQQDINKVRQIGFSLWDSVAAKSPRCAKLVNIVKTQMRDLGKIRD